MMKLLWKYRHTPTASVISSASASTVPSTTASKVNLSSDTSLVVSQKPESRPSINLAEVTAATEALAAKEAAATATPPSRRRFWNLGWKLKSKPETASVADSELGGAPKPRATRLFAPLYAGLALGLSLCAWPTKQIPTFC